MRIANLAKEAGTQVAKQRVAKDTASTTTSNTNSTTVNLLYAQLTAPLKFPPMKSGGRRAKK